MKWKTDINKEKQWFLSRKPSNKLIFILLGTISTIWFLVRVIPKPSRAAYPCMQAAAPFAAAFLSYFSGLILSAGAIRFLRQNGKRMNMPGIALAILLVSAGLFMMLGSSFDIGLAGNKMIVAKVSLNDPIGVARGIFPGRVVWVWNPEATDENCTNEPGDYWFQDDNVDTEAIEDMFSKSIQLLTGESSDSLAWDALFRSYNETHGNGNVGYQPGQKIVIKINLTTGGWANIDTNTYEKIQYIEMMDVTPQLVVYLLHQLIDVVGVAQEDISIGDPIRHFYKMYWDRCHSLYPDVKYLDWHGRLGRTLAVTSSEPVIHYSDGTISDKLPQAYLDADYMINMGCLKQHNLAGGTFCAKNHYGSICRDWASHLHYALPSPTVNGFENLGYGKYRNLVDLMEHKDLGEKTMLFIVDGIWGGDLPVCEPVKWQIDPFNDDWPNSIFVSQDHVAIESVGIDFVRAQFDDYADMLGADDYLQQAADSSYWAEGIIYDPEGDGELIPSMGVHEHWNNDLDKEYSRNLGIGDGIELYKYLITGINEDEAKALSDAFAYPNPFTDRLHLEWGMAPGTSAVIILYDASGKIVRTSGRVFSTGTTNQWDLHTSDLVRGMYYYVIRIEGKGNVNEINGKVIKI